MDGCESGVNWPGGVNWAGEEIDSLVNEIDGDGEGAISGIGVLIGLPGVILPVLLMLAGCFGTFFFTLTWRLKFFDHLESNKLLTSSISKKSAVSIRKILLNRSFL